ncbi:PilT/PilU family type 4a pilus ATPase [Entomomonas asaccharolytica]|uniref:PilT/PilU family type 4a pilus ATPase n=1 Tax=Entomomonas asaccharolytica TaxID=2785331 RepID=A0A974RXX4_9GAMM|nr:PilT/PilU family type 4a pilus ATPase [Entomomonas asaccharolytica]QQP86587.1 PilT/PilU family type 4a pilus ATPase [Entomomonas asaccharolytica]
MEFEKLLQFMVDKKASDLFLTVGVPPCIKVDGKLSPLPVDKLNGDRMKELARLLMTERQQKEFASTQECNFAVSYPGIGRFRVSAYIQRNQVGMVLRRIVTEIPSLEQLALPRIIKDLAMVKRGLVLFVGATGAGKSTSLAAMVDYRNTHSTGHIISIEDPIEYLFNHKNCIVTQREVGLDTESFEIALKNTLRQAPDVIMIGEVRTRQTMEYALAFAETGHLCLATLHANNANQALDRIISFFPTERHSQVWLDLSLNLRAIVAQQLIPNKTGVGRQAAVEVLLGTPLVSDMIRTGQVTELKGIMSRSVELGMQTFDQALFDLFERGLISYESALACADSVNDLRLMIKLNSEKNVKASSSELSGVKLKDYDDEEDDDI